MWHISRGIQNFPHKIVVSLSILGEVSHGRIPFELSFWVYAVPHHPFSAAPLFPQSVRGGDPFLMAECRSDVSDQGPDLDPPKFQWVEIQRDSQHVTIADLMCLDRLAAAGWPWPGCWPDRKLFDT